MNNINLSKSSYCSGVQCEKIIWLNKYKHDFSTAEINETALENGKKVGELAKGLFGDYEDVPYDKNRFLASHTYQKAVAMCILQLGELAKQLSDEFLSRYPEMPWRIMARTRDH